MDSLSWIIALAVIYFIFFRKKNNSSNNRIFKTPTVTIDTTEIVPILVKKSDVSWTLYIKKRGEYSKNYCTTLTPGHYAGNSSYGGINFRYSVDWN